MGVWYEGFHGIGYKVESKDEVECYWEFFDELESTVNSDFQVFIDGNQFSGEADEVYIVIKDAFRCGNNLNYVKSLLDEELERLNLKSVSEFSCVGGILVC